MTELELKIKEAAQVYYTDGSSDLSDAEFDALVEQLRRELPESELLKKVGWGYDINYDTTPGKKYPHKYGEVGSLDKAHNWDELSILFQTSQVDVSAKLDGCSVVLYYTNGQLTQALTRGNGKIGIDITDKVIRIINPTIEDKWFSGAVRGEIVMSHYNFQRFKELHPEAKNARNSTTGLINCKNVTEDLQFLDVIPYSVVGLDLNVWAAHTEVFETISAVRSWIARNFEKYVRADLHILQPDTFFEVLDKDFTAWSIDYPIDGLVITAPYLDIDGAGVVTQLSQAFKFKSEVAQSKVVEVEWNMSKSGYTIPRVKIEPIELAGTTVQWCTGYNAKYIKDNNIGAGSIVTVEKRGEIIPNINEVVAIAREVTLPRFCSSCNCELQWSGVHLKCQNLNCGNSTFQDTMIWTNILAPVDNLGDSLKEKYFIEMYGTVPTIEVLMSEKPIAFSTAPEGTQAHRMREMFNSLFGNTPISISDAIRALNIPRFGDITATKLAQYPEYVKGLINISKSRDGVDAALEERFWSDLRNLIGDANTAALKDNLSKIKRLSFIWNRIQWEAVPATTSEVKGKVAITGKLSVKRSVFEQELKDAGYIPGSIAKDTKFLITDDPNSSSSKNKKADEWGITKITEAQFRKSYM